MVLRWRFICLIGLLLSSTVLAQGVNWEKTENADFLSGFFPLHLDAANGAVYLEIHQLEQDFLYVNSLRTGLGSNDIGLDRGQLGDTRIVRFERHGDKVLLVQGNLEYRANSTNQAERKAVEEAFAISVLWGFPIAEEKDGVLLIDLSTFLLQDAHGIAQRLKSGKQGSFQVDPSRSAIYQAGCKNFPKNTELEAIISLKGRAEGAYLRSVAPTSSAISARIHHSFIQLPDANYQIRTYDPRSGYFSVSFADYAQPIAAPLQQLYLQRHRLEKKNPNADKSEAVEPIVYYIDPGTPEPIKSALMEGAQWWNQAFEAAGYIDAFQIKELPEGADPLDVRYNVIQWVHRSTRGWSYGATVTDPRTGEIIKGHVSLGSLRVRQDFLIAQGLLAPYENGTEPDPAVQELALARLRQLSAHEVGHTLGLAHNFAASYNDRASVMDYPHPLVLLNEEGVFDTKAAYDVGIGDWDKRTILYGYQDFPTGTNEQEALDKILKQNERLGLLYLSDQDARPQGGGHPYAHLWDNGKDPVEELDRIMDMRAVAIASFGSNNLAPGRPMAELEAVFVPLYYAHRYQMEAVVKLIGGVQYDYSINGQSPQPVSAVSPRLQKEAFQIILKTMTPEVLAIPSEIRSMIPPYPAGFNRHRELLPSQANLFIDPLASAQGMIDFSLGLLLHPDRLARVIVMEENPEQMGVSQMLIALCKHVGATYQGPGLDQQVQFILEKQTILHIAKLATRSDVHAQIKAEARWVLQQRLETWEKKLGSASIHAEKAHLQYLMDQVEEALDDPEEWTPPMPQSLPPGSPIGCGHQHGL